ncbi:class I SAM-dependent methyltransferase [Aquabacterium sp. J223]|uniref:class I SAM-dependent methyltransferase n=1 Tax=Aquabacterium sp. J223 TaxID=2898431 RepID=UPI0021ADEDAE|nr:class I SAM-dependent methyltransferase [Aquabacterium sp. J223]UUX95982.1 class I SAM-dependent methyltransferase [Aquabacterium sp. J223]
MNPIESIVQEKLSAVERPLALVLPGGKRLGPADAAVCVELKEMGPLAHLAASQVGKLAEDYVEGRLVLHGTLRDTMDVAASLIGGDPTHATVQRGVRGWWQALQRLRDSGRHHTTEADARQIQFHYDVSDDFYALWLDPRRVYSCAYYREPTMTLAQAQEAKLDHICRKLMLREGERFLDIGAGWGGLLMWAAEHYGVHATGITLSKNQHAHVNRLIQDKGLQGRVQMQLLDYRHLSEDQPWDKIASVGMFEHVGKALLPTYFEKLRRLLKPGGLLMNHGITAGGTRNHQLGAGMGDFIERYIFPGGELEHISHVLEVMSETGWEATDVENLRPHYARTCWAWSDNLEAQLQRAAGIVPDKVLRAYRLYLAGCGMCFERGWISLHQVLATRPSGDTQGSALPGAQSVYPFNREYIYR